jgi:DNA-binding response OmpR family regulator
MAHSVLVVDDDGYMRDLLRLHLCAAGYEVAVAEDAVVAGHLLLTQRVDLILVDIEMPYMSGLEFVRAVKSEATVCSIPVVFVTAHGEYEERGIELGAVAYLRKPLRAEDLLPVVAKHVNASRQLIG